MAQHPYYTNGRKVSTKIFRYGLPVMTGTIVNTEGALWGMMRIKLEDGDIVPAAFPPLEMFDEEPKAKKSK